MILTIGTRMVVCCGELWAKHRTQICQPVFTRCSLTKTFFFDLNNIGNLSLNDEVAWENQLHYAEGYV